MNQENLFEQLEQSYQRKHFLHTFSNKFDDTQNSYKHSIKVQAERENQPINIPLLNIEDCDSLQSSEFNIPSEEFRCNFQQRLLNIKQDIKARYVHYKQMLEFENLVPEDTLKSIELDLLTDRGILKESLHRPQQKSVNLQTTQGLHNISFMNANHVDIKPQISVRETGTNPPTDRFQQISPQKSDSYYENSLDTPATYDISSRELNSDRFQNLIQLIQKPPRKVEEYEQRAPITTQISSNSNEWQIIENLCAGNKIESITKTYTQSLHNDFFNGSKYKLCFLTTTNSYSYIIIGHPMGIGSVFREKGQLITLFKDLDNLKGQKAILCLLKLEQHAKITTNCFSEHKIPESASSAYIRPFRKYLVKESKNILPAYLIEYK